MTEAANETPESATPETIVDLAARVAEALGREDYYNSVDPYSFDPENEVMLGEVPEPLRPLHNLVKEIGDEAKALIAEAREAVRTYDEDVEKLLRDGEPLKEMPEGIKRQRSSIADAQIEIKLVTERHASVKDLFFQSLNQHFPAVKDRDLALSGLRITGDWKVVGMKKRESSNPLEELFEGLFGGGISGMEVQITEIR